MEDADFAQEMLAQCVAGRTHQIARIVSQNFDQALKPFGLTSNQLTLLCMVALFQPTSSTEMLPYLKMEQSTLSRNLERLERNGWIERAHAADDSRKVALRLTVQGSAKLREARPGWDAAQDWARDALGATGITDIAQTAHRLNPLMPIEDASD